MVLRFPQLAVRAALLSLAVTMAACSSLELDTPDGFLELSGGDQGVYRAATHDGARIWCRELAIPADGSLEFWSQALLHDFVARRGYERTDSAMVEDKNGRQGAVHQFTVERNGNSYGYLIALFVDDDAAQTVEFVAPRPRFDELAPSVQAALSTFR